jgi:hypothetical protein
MSLPSWSQYQEDAAGHFRRLGLQAETNVTLQGARSTHNVDVVVRFERAGIPHLWVVECKDYSRPVEREKSLALRTVVDDVGADRGFLLCERGFQRGAYEAVQMTNVLATSLAELEVAGSEELFRVEVANVELRVHRVERSWRALHPPMTKNAAGAWSGRLPILPDDSWPPGGPIALTGRISEAHHAVERARFNEFPVLLADPDADRPVRVDRQDFFPAINSVLARIEETVALAKRPDS